MITTLNHHQFGNMSYSFVLCKTNARTFLTWYPCLHWTFWNKGRIMKNIWQELHVIKKGGQLFDMNVLNGYMFWGAIIKVALVKPCMFSSYLIRENIFPNFTKSNLTWKCLQSTTLLHAQMSMCAWAIWHCWLCET